MSKKWTEREDMADDRKRGVRQGSKRDRELDKKRGLPKSHAKKYHKVSTVLQP